MAPKRTPLYHAHVALGAKMVDFAGYQMPVRYSSESEEHLAVRKAVGVFDVSHMGEVFVEGEGALDFIRGLVTNDAARIVDGQAMYAGLLNERGTFIDDVIVYRFSPTRFLVCVNASNQDQDFAWIEQQARSKVPALEVTNQGGEWSQLAVQGPQAVDVVAKLCGEGVREMGGYHFKEGQILGGVLASQGIIARTGYTGEDGFELYVNNAHAREVWNAVLAAGALPCGLACRDTLRLEAGMCLYGNDIDDEHTPLEANLGWIVKLPEPGKERPPFVGMDVLIKQKAEGARRLLRGLEMVDRGIARHGYPVCDEAGAPIGVVTSGTQTPFLNKAIAMAYLDIAHSAPGHTVRVEVRGRKLKATVVKLPCYRRPGTASPASPART